MTEISNINDLIEDEDGAPYPVCVHCPEQIALQGKRPHWSHIYQSDDGHRHYLYNCQRPFDGVYGPPNVALPERHDGELSTSILSAGWWNIDCSCGWKTDAPNYESAVHALRIHRAYPHEPMSI